MGRSKLIILLSWISCIGCWSQLSIFWGQPQRLKGQEALLSVLGIGSDLVWVKINQPPLGYHRVTAQRFGLPTLYPSEAIELHNGRPFRSPGSLMRPEFRGMGIWNDEIYLFTQVHDPVQGQTFSAARKVFSTEGEQVHKPPFMLKRFREVESPAAAAFYFLHPPYFDQLGVFSKVRSGKQEGGYYSFSRFGANGDKLMEYELPELSIIPEQEFERIEWVAENKLRIIQQTNLSTREARRRGMGRAVTELYVVHEFTFEGDSAVWVVDSLSPPNFTLLEVGSLGEYGLWAATQKGKEGESKEIGWIWFKRNADNELKMKYFTLGVREEFEQHRLNLPAFSFPLEQEITPMLTHWFPVSGGLLWVGEVRNQGEFCQTDFRSNRLICTPYVLCEDILIALIDWEGEPLWQLRIPRQQFLQGERSVGLASHWATFRNDKLYLLWNDDLRNSGEQNTRWAFVDPGRSRLASLEVSLSGEAKRGWVDAQNRRSPAIAPAFCYVDSANIFITGLRGSRMLPGVVLLGNETE